MTNFSSPWDWRVASRGRWLSGVLGVLLLLLSQFQTAQASHIRAGDIQARVDTTVGTGFNARRIFFRLTVYTDRNSTVKEDTAKIYFGDGSCVKPEAVARSTGYGLPKSSPIQITADTDINYYYFEHTYNSNGSFVVSYIGENRITGVRNMDKSENKSFYISTRITIDPALGRNHSAVLKAPAVDKGAVLQVYLHNPAASDADGDSLAFYLKESQEVPLGVPGVSNCRPRPEIVSGFRFPQLASPSGKQVPYDGIPSSLGGDGAILVQDFRTGQLTWNAPGDAGIYNVAFVVEEWRRTPQGVRLIGEVIRDMQIIVKATNNLRPAIKIPMDTCVIAGANIIKTNITATDGVGPGSQPATPLVMTAFAGILPPTSTVPPASFQQTQAGPPLARGRFEWQTECDNVALEPYQVLFRVQDTPPSGGDPTPLIDQRVWRITVVGPPPQNLVATAAAPTLGNTTQLNWNRYTCQSPAGTPVDRQVRILIFRKEGSANFTPGPCDTGIPAGLGYKQIGSVGADAQSFIDDNGGKGLERGKTYCYRIYAVFPLPAGGESIASQEACIKFDGRAAMLTNVDVDRTGAADGQITVRWTKPVAPKSQGEFKAPYSYRLSRAEGLTPAPASFTVIAPPITNLADTVFVDKALNTLDRQYTYKLEFLTQGANNQTNIELSPTASSVRVTAIGQGLAKTIVVNWTYQVPWNNAVKSTRIFRRNRNGGIFAFINTVTSTATGGTYTDTDPTLVLGQTYCYYVQTEGLYQEYKFLQSLLNKSQEFCAPLASEPCAPILTVRPINCDSIAGLSGFPQPGQVYENRLRWTLGSTPAGCSNDNTKYFRIFSRRTEEGALVLQDSTEQLGFVDRNLPSNAACYAVQAVDVNGRRSPLSNVVCVDNCLFFVLPNIFTPNNDRVNDTFRPKVSSPVRKVRFQVFNRWGVKVYEGNQNPLIEWDGGGSRKESGNASKVADGIYYYLAEVEFADFKSTKRSYKGWVEIVR